jgi:hypothetical protein
MDIGLALSIAYLQEVECLPLYLLLNGATLLWAPRCSLLALCFDRAACMVGYSSRRRVAIPAERERVAIPAEMLWVATPAGDASFDRAYG